MKVGNILLNRIVAVGMMAVVLVSSISVSFADSNALPKFHYDITVDGLRTEVSCDSVDNKPIYLFEFLSSRYADPLIYIACGSSFSGKQVDYNEKNEIYNLSEIKSYLNHCSMFGDIYCANMTKFYRNNNVHRIVVDLDKYRAFLASGEVKHDSGENYEIHIMSATIHGGLSQVGIPSEWCHVAGDDIEGGKDNPIKKEDFGYPDIYNSTYIHNDPNKLETLDKLYSGQDFQWNRKTTTGFDLTNNDYNYTYIECKVKANYQYNDKFSGKGDWHNFDSYGEMGNLGKVRAESLTHYYTFQELTKTLPKTYDELPDHKMRAINFSAVYYFRVVCMKTSSTVVIPDEKDCKYYAGPWRSVNVTKLNGKDGKSIIEDGNFDENGEWKKDDNSADNGKDIDNGSAEGDDLSDASDKAHETINSNANKSTLDLDSAKAFINQVADVPKMIADIFSFLPDWVRYSFAFGFALIPIIIIFKLIRG